MCTFVLVKQVNYEQVHSAVEHIPDVCIYVCVCVCVCYARGIYICHICIYDEEAQETLETLEL